MARITNFEKSKQLGRRAEDLIPAGCHTYSKGRDQFPELAPDVLVRGEGCRTWDADGNEYIDWGMGLRSVILGHAYEPVLAAVRQHLKLGANFTRPAPIEADVAEKLIELIPCGEMVKFAKNGSDVTTAALRLARACTGRDHIAFCADHPFFSVDDWFIGTTPPSAGIPQSHYALSHRFAYNDLPSLQRIFDEHAEQVAAVIMEPVTDVEPAAGFLEGVRKLTTRQGAVLIFDEMISGFHWHLKGAQHYFGVTPDLATFGKALGNGFSISALLGRREIMDRGGLRHKHKRCFLLSTTHGAETHALAACLATLRELEEKNVVEHLWKIGRLLMSGLRDAAKAAGLEKNVTLYGYPCSPRMGFADSAGKPSAALRTLFLQETIARGVLMPYFAPSFSHDEQAVEQTVAASAEAFAVLKSALREDKIDQYLIGPPIKPVFREFNQ